jgi:CheY-like chemotaxis protein
MQPTPDMPAVLIVEDERAILTLLDLALTQHGFRVILAASGAEAVDLYRQHREAVAVVLMDVQMPGLDGPKTLEALQQINPEVRCCFMSGHAGKYNDAELRAGGASFIDKPFSLAGLFELLTSLVQKQGEVVVEARDLMKEVKDDVKEMKQELREVKEDVKETKEELREVKEAVKEIKEELREVKERDEGT